jgi:hypothetical protein
MEQQSAFDTPDTAPPDVLTGSAGKDDGPPLAIGKTDNAPPPKSLYFICGDAVPGLDSSGYLYGLEARVSPASGCVDQVNGFTCNCPPGFAGTTCETILDSCASFPCFNDGTCRKLYNGYACSGHSGF